MPGGAILQHLAVLELLISRGLPLSVPDIGGFTSLHHCIASASQRTNSFDPATKEKAMRKILTSGADVNYRNRWGDTALHNALQRGDTPGIDLLMEHGADIDIPDGNGLTVRNIYLNTGATVAAAMEKWLLKRSGKEKAPMTGKVCEECGANDKLLRNCSGCLPVQYCSRECQRTRDRWGSTPLHDAIANDHIAGINLLMEHGANVDLPDGNGLSVRLAYIPMGKAVTAAIEKWLLKRSGKAEAPMTGKMCDPCGARGKPLRKVLFWVSHCSVLLS
jgi:ankyrin repeat protein